MKPEDLQRLDDELYRAYRDIYRVQTGPLSLKDHDRIKFLQDVVETLSSKKKLTGLSKQISKIKKGKKKGAGKKAAYLSAIQFFVLAKANRKAVADLISCASRHLEKYSLDVFSSEAEPLYDVMERKTARMAYASLKQNYVDSLKKGETLRVEELRHKLKTRNSFDDFESPEELSDFMIDAGLEHGSRKPPRDIADKVRSMTMMGPQELWPKDFETFKSLIMKYRAGVRQGSNVKRTVRAIYRINSEKAFYSTKELDDIMLSPAEQLGLISSLPADQ